VIFEHHYESINVCFMLSNEIHHLYRALGYIFCEITSDGLTSCTHIIWQQ